MNSSLRSLLLPPEPTTGILRFHINEYIRVAVYCSCSYGDELESIGNVPSRPAPRMKPNKICTCDLIPMCSRGNTHTHARTRIHLLSRAHGDLASCVHVCSMHLILNSTTTTELTAVLEENRCATTRNTRTGLWACVWSTHMFSSMIKCVIITICVTPVGPFVAKETRVKVSHIAVPEREPKTLRVYSGREGQ